MRNLKLAFRTLFKTPFVTAIAILSLALGIGANAAIFSLFDQMLLRPLPVPEPDRLVNLTAPGPKPGSQSCNQAGDCESVFSYRMFRDLEKSTTTLSGLAGHRGFGANLSFHNEPMTGEGMFVSGSYFPTLGITPALGRLIGPSDDENIGANFVTVLSYAFWSARLGSDRSVLGQTIVVDGQTLTIIGVAPKDFEGTTLGTRPLVFVPITMRGALSSGFKDWEERRSYWVYVFGRLKPGVSLAQAKLALNAQYRPIIADVEAPLQKGMSAPTLAKFKSKELGVEMGARGQSQLHSQSRTPLILLFSVTGLVLLIACANIANLLLARGANRAMEMGVRLALGASRRQLMTQLLTESVVLAVMGGAASLFVARGTLGLIASLLPPEATATLRFELQPAVLYFAAALSVGTGLLFGMFPALHSTREDLVTTIRGNAGQITSARGAARFRTTLVTVQIAMATALLISAGLFMKSLVNVTHVNLGLNVDGVVTFAISPERSGYDSVRSQLLYGQVEDAMRQVPGVTGVTASLVPLLAGDNWGNDVYVQGFQSGPDVDNHSRFNEVDAGYFSTLGVHLISGREFGLDDRLGSSEVAVVNEAFAKKFNLGRDAVGKYMGTKSQDSMNILIVGLVQNAKYSDVKDEVPPVFFTPRRQDTRVGFINFYVRSSLPLAQLVHAIPEVMRRIDPELPVEDLKTMPQQIRDNIFLDRMISILSAAFAILATILAAVGLYGVLAYTVAQRTREIGIRMALGANGGQVRGMVMRQVGGMTLVGGLLGAAGALGVGRGASSLLFGLQGHDPVVFGLSCLVLTLVSLGAGYVPARRASEVNP
ncbi:MAG: ABC transporter permease, partial [Gemmatimonadota bacterium]